MATKKRHSLTETRLKKETLTRFDRDALAKLFEDGGNMDDAALHFRSCPSTVQRVAQHWGLKTRSVARKERRQLTPEMEASLRAFSADKHSLAQMAKALGIAEGAVSRHLAALSLPAPHVVKKERLSINKMEIIALVNQGISWRDTAKRLNLTLGQVSGVVHRARTSGDVTLDHTRKIKGRPSPVAVQSARRRRTEIVVELDLLPKPKGPRTFKAPITFEELTDGKHNNACKYPIGSGPRYMFCGEPKAVGQYCLECAKVCFEPPKPKKDRHPAQRFESNARF